MHKLYAYAIFGLAILSYFYFQAYPICSSAAYCGANNPLNWEFPLGVALFGLVVYLIGGRLEGEKE